MKELFEYRKGLIERFVNIAEEFSAACLKVQDIYEPLADSQWNVHRVAAHVRDVDKLVYGLRARRTAAEQDPEFESFDGESYMAEHYSASEPLYEIVDELRANVEHLSNWLRDLPPEAWSRTSRHATLGHGFTLQAWVERGLAHIEEHLDAVNRNQQSFEKNNRA